MRAQEFINEISDERLQDYLSRAGRKVDRRMTRMAQARDRLNKGYEIYHAETPSKIVDKFDARTPAEAQRYYNNFIKNYESDVDYDLRLRRATGLTEAFDQPYQLIWEKGDYGSYDAYTRLPDGSNLSINFNLESAGPYGEDEQWQVEFWRNNSLAVTGEGDAQRIFATVLAAIADFVEQEDHPESIAFSASKDVEPGQNAQSRAKLYDRLVQRYAASLGYLVSRHESGDKVTYELTRKASVEENFADGKKPGRKGLAKRMGVNCKQSVSKLRKIAKNSSGERARMAHWCANMKSGKKKNK
jgi:hypothetical protein